MVINRSSGYSSPTAYSPTSPAFSPTSPACPQYGASDAVVIDRSSGYSPYSPTSPACPQNGASDADSEYGGRGDNDDGRASASASRDAMGDALAEQLDAQLADADAAREEVARDAGAAYDRWRAPHEDDEVDAVRFRECMRELVGAGWGSQERARVPQSPSASSRGAEPPAEAAASAASHAHTMPGGTAHWWTVPPHAHWGPNGGLFVIAFIPNAAPDGPG